MIWLWSYLAVGVLVLACVLYVSRKDRVSSSSSALLAAIRGPQSWKDAVIEKFVAPFLGGLFVSVGWPVALWMTLRSYRERKLEIHKKEEAAFKVKQGDLKRFTTMDEVEKSERIVDPLGAVPDLPFGHLHQVWKDFVCKRPLNAELWSFSCDWTNEWNWNHAREGYVWVVDSKPEIWMLTRDISVRIVHDTPN